MNRQMNNIITDIVPQVNSPSRFSVFIDGEFSFGISDFDLYNLRLSKGDEITEEKMAEIESIIDIDKCKNYAIDLVSKKMYTEKEIRIKMKHKEFSQTAIDSVVDILKEYGYINDEAYATVYCEHYMQKYGVKKLEFELKNKGVDSDIIENALLGVKNDDTLEEMIRKKVGTKELDFKEYSKTVRYFLSKGFEYDVIQEILNKLRDEN